MNSQKIKKIIAVGLTSSIVLTTLSESTQLVSAKELQSNYSSETQNDEAKKEIYLSDIDYIKKDSSVGYGSIMKDLNTDGKKISLNVDGETVEFNKGMGCHAPSTLVYDISKYKDKYTRFVSYLGIDSRQGAKGDGVIFKIYTSKDGKKWDLVEDSGVVKGNEEAKYVDINLNGANYIKLCADQNKNNGNDHSVYGDAKLVKDDYSLAGVKIDNLHPLKYYDDILSSKGVEYNMQHNQMMILRRAFVNRVGYESIQRIASKSKDYADAIDYLLNNELALKYFITGGPVNIGGSYQRSLRYFCDIYAKYKDELKNNADDNFNLRLAISISLAFAREEMVKFWVSSDKPVDSVKRYEAFKKLIELGKMDEAGKQENFGKWSTKQFKDLPIPLMRWDVDTRLNDDEILWLADYALKQKNMGKKFLDAYNYIQYRDGYNYDNPKFFDKKNFNYYNDKYDFSKYYNDFGQKGIHRLWMVFEEGSVCGGLAQTYSVLSEVFGRPSSPCGQPGHAASITYGWHNKNKRYEWMLQNDVSGWTQTGNQFDDRMLNWGVGDWSKVSWHNASYVVLATDAVYDSENYLKATMLNLLADSYSDNKIKESIYKEALKYQKINLDSMNGLIDSYKKDNTIQTSTYLDLAKEIISDFTYYPQVMMELLDKLKDNITDKANIAQLDLLIHQALIKASNATPELTSNVQACKQLADFYLNKKSNELATFSFDGNNANKIVINPKYEGSSIRVKYSLDGGKNWKETDNQVIELSSEELNSINAENNIIVGLVGDNVTYTIDILPGKKIDNSVIYANDLENALIGNLDNLEFSLDNGKTWCDYPIDKSDSSRNNANDSEGSIRFDGDKSVKVRYKAHGNYLKSNEFDYKFTKDTDTDTRKYVQLKNIHVTEYSSQNDKNHAATNFIDGTPNTSWHTTFGKREKDKFYTVKLDKVRYITSLEYLSLGNNGKLKNGKIYTSLDGKEWTQSGTFKDLARDNTLKVLNLDKPTACRYIKIVADNTYGNTPGECDMYFSGNMLNFYEDATKNYDSNPTIKYSSANLTKDDVIATITLPKGCTIIGDNTYTFTGNGTHTFRYTDIDGEEKTIDATVDWIDKEAPKATVVYSTKNPTNGNVIVTLNDISPDAKVKNNNGEASYTFTENGSFEFELEDTAGNITKIPVKVDWIDKEAPKATVVYSTKNPTNGNVIVTLNDISPDAKVKNNNGEASYTFTENGSFEFELEDAAGNITKIPVKVDWIDKESPTATVVYSTKNPTNGNVIVTLNDISPDAKVKNNNGEASYTFKENGSFEFELEDKAGNITKIPVAVSWIDKERPVVKVSYSETNKTNKDVTVTIGDLQEGEYIENNNGKASYTFKENGVFNFIIKDKAGNTTIVPTAVNWIDKVAPTATVVYDINTWTKDNVTAKLSNISKKVTMLNGGSDSYTFKDNGCYKFEFVDEAGNVGVAEAKVTWIDKSKKDNFINFENINDKKGQEVKACLDINPNEVEVLNNDGKPYYLFNENKTFIFKLRLKSTGYEFEVPVTVDWIKKDSDAGIVNRPDSSDKNGSVNNGVVVEDPNNNSSNNNLQDSNITDKPSENVIIGGNNTTNNNNNNNNTNNNIDMPNNTSNNINVGSADSNISNETKNESSESKGAVDTVSDEKSKESKDTENHVNNSSYKNNSYINVGSADSGISNETKNESSESKGAVDTVSDEKSKDSKDTENHVNNSSYTNVEKNKNLKNIAFILVLSALSSIGIWGTRILKRKKNK